MVKHIKVLIIPAGSGMAIPAIKALNQIDEIFVISADSDELAPGLYFSDRGYIISMFRDKLFYQELKEIVKREKIDVIIPCLDTILLPLSEIKDEFEKINAKILVSDPRTIKITRDKWKTYQELKGVIPLPKSFIKKETVDIDFPLFIKPRGGSGSIDIHKLHSEEELNFFYKRVEEPIIQEYLKGKEYTVDCLADMNGKYILSLIRERISTKAGISTQGKIVLNEDLESMAKKICKKLKFRGPFFFQAKEDEEGVPKLIEVNARISGTMCLSNASGINIHALAIKLCMREKIEIPKLKEGIYLTRFWEEIYLTKEEIYKKLYNLNDVFKNQKKINFSSKVQKAL